MITDISSNCFTSKSRDIIFTKSHFKEICEPTIILIVLMNTWYGVWGQLQSDYIEILVPMHSSRLADNINIMTIFLPSCNYNKMSFVSSERSWPIVTSPS